MLILRTGFWVGHTTIIYRATRSYHCPTLCSRIFIGFLICWLRISGLGLNRQALITFRVSSLRWGVLTEGVMLRVTGEKAPKPSPPSEILNSKPESLSPKPKSLKAITRNRKTLAVVSVRCSCSSTGTPSALSAAA